MLLKRFRPLYTLSRTESEATLEHRGERLAEGRQDLAESSGPRLQTSTIEPPTKGAESPCEPNGNLPTPLCPHGCRALKLRREKGEVREEDSGKDLAAD